MVKLVDFAEKTATRQRVLENIKYTKSLTDDELILIYNNERLKLKGNNREIFDRLRDYGDPLINKVDEYLEDIDEHCGPAATAWDLDIPYYTWLKKIQDRSITQKEYEGMMNGTEPIVEWISKKYNPNTRLYDIFVIEKDYLK